MTVDTFTKTQFEDAIETICTHVRYQLRWEEMKTYRVGKEFVYEIPTSHLSIILVIHSSVNTITLESDGSGENSIRVWVKDPYTNKPLMGKTQKWITRVEGWESRLMQVITDLLSKIMQVDFCDDCRNFEHIYKVRKEGANKGRFFKRCQCKNSFEWLKDEEEIVF